MSQTRFTPGTIYRAVLLAFALVVAGLIFQQLRTLILAVLIVVVLALPMSAFADLLQRTCRVPRPIGALLALLIGLGAIGWVIALIVPVVSHEVNQFVNSLPTIVNDIRHRLAGLTGTSPTRVGTQIQHFVNGYTQHPTKLLGPAASIGASVVGAIAALVVVLLTALYTAIHPGPLVSGLVRMVPPQGRPKAETILCRLGGSYTAWLRGLVIGMCVLGGLTYLGLLVVGLPFAAFFAIFTAVAMIVPYFGALVSSIPPILFALTFSPGKAVLVAVVYILAHQLESNVIQPLVVARTVKLHPAVVAIGVVAVDRLFGFVGLVVAVPILATVQILIDELWVKPMEERCEADLVQQPARIAPIRDSVQSSG
jgi:predicted PurR-regulated permease PerM